MDAYATPADLSGWLQATAPADAVRLLARASEVVEQRVLSGYNADANGNPLDDDVAAWLRDATCAQVEFWLVVSEQHGIGGVFTGTMSAGGVSHNMPREVGPRALQILDRAGLRTPVGGGCRPYRRPLDLIGRSYE